jgi:ABC-type antimicrobial peptide transport system permease subunit
VRTTNDAPGIVGTLREKINELEPLRSVYAIAPLEQLIGDAYAQTRIRTALLGFFAAGALLLSCLGVYGTLSYIVGLHRREVGLRMAVGAVSRQIASQYLLKAIRVVGIACLTGFGLALVFSGTLSSMLYGISPTDSITLVAVIAVVFVVATAAALVPSVRASRIDPIRALREE